MTTHPPFRKVFVGVATREEMFRLFNHHRDDPDVDPVSGKPYSSEWFEIEPAQYHFMLGLLPPLFQRSGMFGLSEYKAGNVTSVFFAIRIRGRERWFHGFCDISNKLSPDAMRAAIIAHEAGAVEAIGLGHPHQVQPGLLQLGDRVRRLLEAAAVAELHADLHVGPLRSIGPVPRPVGQP